MRAGWLALVALWGAGCVLPDTDRVRDFNEDGVYLFAHRDYRAARESFQAALALQPEDAALLYNIGECSDRLGDDANAEKYYRECLQRAPNHPACRHALLVILVRTNRRNDAVQLVQGWMTQDPKGAFGYAEDGWLARQTGDLPRAQARLQQALELDPHNVRALTEMAMLDEDMNRPDRALVLYERILDQDPKQLEIMDRVNYLLAHGARRPHPD